jgi:hypothetical protein
MTEVLYLVWTLVHSIPTTLVVYFVFQKTAERKIL